jgi:hypothetical protein
MIIIFVMVILVLTQVLGSSKERSMEARHETNAVCLAQNTAQAVAASRDIEDLKKLLDERNNAKTLEKDGEKFVNVSYDEALNPDPRGDLIVQASWQEETGKQGTYISSQIQVYSIRSGSQDPIYTMDTGYYVQEANS